MITNFLTSNIASSDYQSFGDSGQKGTKKMPLPIIRYTLDPTGLNPDNRVVGEIHNLTSRDIRAVAPIYGAYYADSLRVYDNSTDRLLARGTDYQCVELLQDASLKYGKEICLVLLILNKQTSNQVRINYQVLGGGFQNQADALITIYENVIKDNRPVEWINVLSKPAEYPPSLHQHLINDVVGFQSLIHSIERVRNAIILSDVPAFEALIQHVDEQVEEIKQILREHIYNLEIDENGEEHLVNIENPHNVTKAQIGLSEVENLGVVTIEEINEGIPIRKYVTYDMLLHILQMWTDVAKYRLVANLNKLKEGYSLACSVETDNLADNTKLYWTIQHLTTNDADFSTTAGVVTVVNNLAYFGLSVLTDEAVEGTETFRLLLRKESPTGLVIASSGVITIEDYVRVPDNSVLELAVENVFDPRIVITPKSFFVINSNHPLISTRKTRTGGPRSFDHRVYTKIKLGMCLDNIDISINAETLFHSKNSVRLNRLPTIVSNPNITNPGYIMPTSI
jgi:hypothetical protein